MSPLTKGTENNIGVTVMSRFVTVTYPLRHFSINESSRYKRKIDIFFFIVYTVVSSKGPLIVQLNLGYQIEFNTKPRTVHNTPVMNILKGYFYVTLF